MVDDGCWWWMAYNITYNSALTLDNRFFAGLLKDEIPIWRVSPFLGVLLATKILLGQTWNLVNYLPGELENYFCSVRSESAAKCLSRSASMVDVPTGTPRQDVSPRDHLFGNQGRALSWLSCSVWFIKCKQRSNQWFRIQRWLSKLPWFQQSSGEQKDSSQHPCVQDTIRTPTQEDTPLATSLERNSVTEVVNPDEDPTACDGLECIALIGVDKWEKYETPRFINYHHSAVW